MIILSDEKKGWIAMNKNYNEDLIKYNEDSIKIAVKNIDNYINELTGRVNEEVINKLTIIREQIKQDVWRKNFNLIYKDSDDNIVKICNEKYIYQYKKEGDVHYRVRTEIDGENPYIYPKQKVEKNQAIIDLEIMESREPIYV